MTEETNQGYLTEIAYQKHMLKNLQRYMTLTFFISTISVVLLYYFHSHIFDTLFFVVLTVISVLATLVLLYGIILGRKNVNKVIDQFEKLIRS